MRSRLKEAEIMGDHSADRSKIIRKLSKASNEWPPKQSSKKRIKKNNGNVNVELKSLSCVARVVLYELAEKGN